MLFCFVCCLYVLVVTWTTSCRTSTSSHYGNYSAKAPAIESSPACNFHTSQGNSKSQCHLLNTFKCGPSSRLYDKWGDPPHVTTPIWGPHLHVNRPQVSGQDGWELAKLLLLFCFVFLFIVGVKKRTMHPSWLKKLGLSRTYFVAKKRTFLLRDQLGKYRALSVG